MDILRLKHGNFDFWSHSIPTNCSWFFQGLCKTANIIKPFLWINSYNPNSILVLHDPWLFEILIALKPTFINVDLDLDSYSMQDFHSGNGWNYDVFMNVFGASLDSPVLVKERWIPMVLIIGYGFPR